MACMPGASSQPHVAARQDLKHCSRFWRPVAKVLIFTGWTLMDHGIAASSGSEGPGLTTDFWRSAGASRVLLTQPRAHWGAPAAHLDLPAAAPRKLAFLASWGHGHVRRVLTEDHAMELFLHVRLDRRVLAAQPLL